MNADVLAGAIRKRKEKTLLTESLAKFRRDDTDDDDDNDSKLEHWLARLQQDYPQLKIEQVSTPEHLTVLHVRNVSSGGLTI